MPESENSYAAVEDLLIPNPSGFKIDVDLEKPVGIYSNTHMLSMIKFFW